MAGTKSGGLKAAATIKRIKGENFYKEIGGIGGRRSTTGGFASLVVGADGLTGPERARIVGSRGGKISRRGKAKNNNTNITEEHVDE